jgi:hypothetical protein
VNASAKHTNSVDKFLVLGMVSQTIVSTGVVEGRRVAGGAKQAKNKPMGVKRSGYFPQMGERITAVVGASSREVAASW